MNAKVKDLTGLKVGRLTVKKLSGYNKHRQAQWECLCDCGRRKVVTSQSLVKGWTKSCGCLYKETRQMAGARGALGKFGRTADPYDAVDDDII